MAVNERRVNSTPWLNTPKNLEGDPSQHHYALTPSAPRVAGGHRSLPVDVKRLGGDAAHNWFSFYCKPGLLQELPGLEKLVRYPMESLSPEE